MEPLSDPPMGKRGVFLYIFIYCGDALLLWILNSAIKGGIIMIMMSLGAVSLPRSGGSKVTEDIVSLV